MCLVHIDIGAIWHVCMYGLQAARDPADAEDRGVARRKRATTNGPDGSAPSGPFGQSVGAQSSVVGITGPSTWPPSITNSQPVVYVASLAM